VSLVPQRSWRGIATGIPRGDQVISRFSTTHAAICARELNPSLVRMCSTWASAVRCETTNCPAMSLLVRPAATSSAICSSRRVSLAGPIREDHDPERVSCAPRAKAIASSGFLRAPSSQAAANALSPSWRTMSARQRSARSCTCAKNRPPVILHRGCATPSRRAARSYLCRAAAIQASTSTLRAIPRRSPNACLMRRLSPTLASDRSSSPWSKSTTPCIQRTLERTQFSPHASLSARAAAWQESACSVLPIM